MSKSNEHCKEIYQTTLSPIKTLNFDLLNSLRFQRAFTQSDHYRTRVVTLPDKTQLSQITPFEDL